MTTMPSAPGGSVTSDSRSLPAGVSLSEGMSFHSFHASRSGLRDSKSNRPPQVSPAEISARVRCQSSPRICMATLPLIITRSAESGSMRLLVPRTHSTRSEPGRCRAKLSMLSDGSIPRILLPGAASVTVRISVPHPRSTIVRTLSSPAWARKKSWSGPSGLSMS